MNLLLSSRHGRRATTTTRVMKLLLDMLRTAHESLVECVFQGGVRVKNTTLSSVLSILLSRQSLLFLVRPSSSSYHIRLCSSLYIPLLPLPLPTHISHTNSTSFGKLSNTTSTPWYSIAFIIYYLLHKFILQTSFGKLSNTSRIPWYSIAFIIHYHTSSSFRRLFITSLTLRLSLGIRSLSLFNTQSSFL